MSFDEPNGVRVQGKDKSAADKRVPAGRCVGFLCVCVCVWKQKQKPTLYFYRIFRKKPKRLSIPSRFARTEIVSPADYTGGLGRRIPKKKNYDLFSNDFPKHTTEPSSLSDQIS